MTRCTGCGCEFPVDYGSPNQFGQHRGPCCSDTSFYSNLACGYAIVFGCEHAWWKHQQSTEFGRTPQPMLIPPGYYDGIFTSEPSATYTVTFLGRDTSHGECRYVQKEGLGAYPATRSDCAQEASDLYDRNCASLYHRLCNLKNATPNSYTGRNPYHIDPVTGAMVQPSAMVFDLRANNDLLRQFYGGTDDDNPTCCWCEPIDDRNCGTCIVNWDGWTLHLTSGGYNPFARSSPRITYFEGLTAFWDEVGRPEPWYGIDSTFGTGGFDPWGPTQFALQNADYWPSLPARVCVYPVRWPFFNSPCDSEDEQCESCAPAIVRGVESSIGAAVDCELQGFYLADLNTCVGGVDGTMSGSIRPIGCGEPAIISVYLPFEPDLPSGVTDPGSDCGYWFKELEQPSDTSCDDPQAAYWIGLMVYWDGSAWKVTTYCSDDGVTYSAAGSATVSNVECTDIGVRFDFSATGVTCVCCSSSCCDPWPDEVTLSDGTNSLVLTGDGSGTFTGFGVDIAGCGTEIEWTVQCSDEGGEDTITISPDSGPDSCVVTSWSCDPFEATCEITGCDFNTYTLTVTE